MSNKITIDELAEMIQQEFTVQREYNEKQFSDIKQTQKEHTKTLNEHGKTLAKHSLILSEYSELLYRIDKRTQDHHHQLNNHGTRIHRLEVKPS